MLVDVFARLIENQRLHVSRQATSLYSINEDKQENAWMLGKGMIMKTRAALRLIAKQPELLDAIRQIREHISKSSKNQVNLGALLSTGEVMMAAVAVHALLASTFASLSKNKEDRELTFHSVTSLVRATPRLEYKGYNNTSHGDFEYALSATIKTKCCTYDGSVVLSYRLELLRGNPTFGTKYTEGMVCDSEEDTKDFRKNFELLHASGQIYTIEAQGVRLYSSRRNVDLTFQMVESLRQESNDAIMKNASVK